MFTVTEAEATTTIRSAFEQEGELSAGIELRRLFPTSPRLEGAGDCGLGACARGCAAPTKASEAWLIC